MGLLIARGASPGNKSGIKRIFSIASKMASKGAAKEIKRLERSLRLPTFEPIFAQRLLHLITHLLWLSMLPMSLLILISSFPSPSSSSSHSLHSLTNDHPSLTKYYLECFPNPDAISARLSLIMRKSGGWDSEKLDGLRYFDKIVIAWHLMSRSNVGNPFQIFAISQQWQIMVEGQYNWKLSWISL